MELFHQKLLCIPILYVWLAGTSALCIWLLTGRRGTTEIGSGNPAVYETHRRVCLFLIGALLGIVFTALIPAIERDMDKIIPNDIILNSYVSLGAVLCCFFLVWLLSGVISNLIVFIRRRREAEESQRILEKTSSGHSHFDLEIESNSISTAILLVLTLGLHQLFEGLAIGMLASTIQVTVMVCMAAIHETLLVVTVALKVRDAGATNARSIIIFILVFSILEPLGIGIGTALSAPYMPPLAISLLRAFATGGTLYVVILEMLPNCVFSDDGPRWLSGAIVAAGGVVVSSLMYIHVYLHGGHSAMKMNHTSG